MLGSTSQSQSIRRELRESAAPSHDVDGELIFKLQTLLEQVILRAMGKSSIPEFSPTRSREYYYPRNAGFKRAYAFEELKRLEEKAKERGLDPSSVNSAYQKIGSKEWDDFEIRNGFREPINTLLLEQHNMWVVPSPASAG